MTALEQVFAGVLKARSADLTDSSTPATVPGWDSLAHINIIWALEEAYGISFSGEEIVAVTSLGAARALLRQKGVAL